MILTNFGSIASSGAGLPPAGNALSTYSWAEIDMISQAGVASSYWSVGNSKNISVNGVSYTCQIIGFNHDNKTSGGKAGITFQLQDCLSTRYSMNATNTNVGGWQNCLMRTSTMDTLYNQIEASLKDVIKNVNKLTSEGNLSQTIITTSDKLFLLSPVEVFGTTTWSFVGEGSRYSFYSDGNSAIKKVSGTADFWWLRSPSNDASTYFCRVTNAGASSRGNASTAYGTAFAFCV